MIGSRSGSEAARRASQSASCHACAGGGRPTRSAAAPRPRSAYGSALRRQLAVLRRGSRTCSGALPHAGDEQLPDARRAHRRIGCSRPSQQLKSPTTLDRARGRRPDREADAGHAVHLAQVRAERARRAPRGGPRRRGAGRGRRASAGTRRGRASAYARPVGVARPRARSASGSSAPSAAWPRTRRPGAALGATGSPSAGAHDDGGRVGAAARGRPRRRPGGVRAQQACGSRWSRATRRSRSEAMVLMSAAAPSSRRAMPATGIPHPVGAVVELVAQLVDGLLELEDRQQLARSPAWPGRQQRRVDGREVALQERGAGALLPALGRGARRAAARSRWPA